MLGITQPPPCRPRSVYSSPALRPSPPKPPSPASSYLDAVLVSHFHLDHCGALPYLVDFFNYQGPVVLTHPTASIVPIMLADFMKVQLSEDGGGGEGASSGGFAYSQRMIDDACALFKKIELLETISLCGGDLLVKCYYAGHVLGAAMFYIQSGDESIVYTGDFNMTADRHLAGAWIERLRPTVLITETTYASTIREIKKSREREFLEEIINTLERGGKVLIPVFALGRAQEICVLLEAFWSRCALPHPIYFAAGLSEKANFFYKTFLQWTNDNLRTTFLQQGHNLFDFAHVKPWDWSLQKTSTPMVVLASPGMLHGGSSLTLFKEWCGDPLNTIIIPGYCMKATVGGQILRGAKSVHVHGRIYEVRAKVCSFSFSAHADYAGIMQLIDKVRPRHLMLVHGEKTVMQTFADKFRTLVGLPVHYPPNGSLLKID